ncbi:unnamed protein product [Bursaphelenchus xylophilus]|uniref:(pine wood nematode) hypothetical protein n=1 Tax=Bursaphelenchus xylophilus TaxID=6326 RepID=A0A1I7STI2_BURXY|nr:unnamed protein product [Bursaphelenchus xylophilus]CAG9108388.1 unnamed protein product [Bursaphelenchus xylophilus]
MDSQLVPQLPWEMAINSLDPLIQDTFLGSSRPASPLPFVKDPSVVFVGPKRDYNGGFEECQNAGEINYAQWFDDTEMDVVIPGWESTHSLNVNIPNITPETVPQSIYPESDQTGFSSPGSTYSSGEWSTGGDSTMTQEDILEEIQRECAEIERHSHSPPSTSSRKLKVRRSHKRTDISNDDRKKQLNRVAATRYREKKRREKEQLWVEEKHLTDRNRQLNETVIDLKAEIGYLRKLLKDMEQRSRSA